jgi:DNA-binding transcriptional regulator YbjK
MRNPHRRSALLDAAVDVLAGEGARGLTFRAVDAAAGVPLGTASNYFKGRDELVQQVGAHVVGRLQSDPRDPAATLARPPDRALDLERMHQLMGKVDADRAGYLALLELRLEAARRPELRAAVTAAVEDGLAASIAFHADAGLPGDRSTVLVLYLAMTGLMLESLTIPEIFGDSTVAELTERIVRTIVPAR